MNASASYLDPVSLKKQNHLQTNHFTQLQTTALKLELPDDILFDCSVLWSGIQELELRDCPLTIDCEKPSLMPLLRILKVEYMRNTNGWFPKNLDVAFPSLVELELSLNFHDITEFCKFPSCLQRLTIDGNGVFEFNLHVLPTSLCHLHWQPSKIQWLGQLPVSLRSLSIMSYELVTHPVPSFLHLTSLETLVLQGTMQRAQSDWMHFQNSLRHLWATKPNFLSNTTFPNLTALCLQYELSKKESLCLPPHLEFLDVCNLPTLQKTTLPKTLKYLFVRNYTRALRKGVLPHCLIVLSLPSFQGLLPKNFDFPSKLVYLHMPKYRHALPVKFVTDEAPTITFDAFVQMGH